MAGTMRFGRRVALPSTIQIKTELLRFAAAERIKELERELAALTAASPIVPANSNEASG